jgi:NAD(P)-dependent dehydrogenase (short-subunit alcohol dehydrogenase family)
VTRDLSGTVALVTGASRGLGHTLALGLAQAGADLALVARSRDDLEATAADAAKFGVRAEAFVADLAEPAAIERFVADAERAFDRIDVLVNNAGIGGREGPVHELRAEDWDRVLAVNLRAPALCAAAVARGMIARQRGRIVNVASIGGLTPLARLGPYCAAKAGLVQLTRVMALELARHRVQVNCVCPGYFRTPMNDDFFATRAGQTVIERAIPMRRLGEPAELVPAVVLLASDGASFMTGSVVVIDGGHTLT